MAEPSYQRDGKFPNNLAAIFERMNAVIPPMKH
jgi:hypothetical protein